MRIVIFIAGIEVIGEKSPAETLRVLLIILSAPTCRNMNFA